MAKRRKNKIKGGFIVLPYSVIDSKAYQELNHPSFHLLFDIARQYNGSNNGKLMATIKVLRARGWTSKSVLNNAIKNLMESNILIRTRVGKRPNVAALYALSWVSIDYRFNDMPDLDYSIEASKLSIADGLIERVKKSSLIKNR